VRGEKEETLMAKATIIVETNQSKEALLQLLRRNLNEEDMEADLDDPGQEKAQVSVTITMEET